MNVAEIKDMSLTEKLQAMEIIWDDLKEIVEDCPLPVEHRNLLDERKKRVASGETNLRNWDEVKGSLGTR